MPPFLQTNIYVNITIEAFDSGLIDPNADLSVSSVTTSTSNMRAKVSSFLTVEDFERGWTYFEVSLSAYKQLAQIKPMLVEKIQLANPDNPEEIKEVHVVSKQYNNSIDAFVLYPTSLNENETRDTRAKIGWQSNEKTTGISHNEIIRELGLQLTTEKVSADALFEIPFYQSRSISGVALQLPSAIPKDDKKLDFEHFVVTKDMAETIYHWIVDSFGFDLNNQTHKEWIKGFYSDEFDIEKYIPFEYADGDFFHDFAVNLVTKAVDDVIVKPVVDIVTDPIKAIDNIIVKPATEAVNTIVKTAIDCTKSFPPCTSVVTGAAINLAAEALGLPASTYVPIDLSNPITGTIPPPPTYPETSDIPEDTNTNIHSTPLEMLSSVIPPEKLQTYLLVGGVVILGGVGILILLLVRRGGSSNDRRGTTTKTTAKK
jgi:hypothetical protein